ncbi:MAG: 30S ribosomal protein S8 [Candidatus Yanofskybacteria bacterium]|nr:30S ribosomal protein S8 [Candidatus Yanofskybacteria bacterium]
MLNQILNAQARGHGEISAPYSKIKWNIAEILKKEGFITEVEKKKKKIKNSEFSFIGLRLKYEDGASAIRGFKMISKP